MQGAEESEAQTAAPIRARTPTPTSLFFIFGQLQVKHVEMWKTFSKAAGQRESNRDLLLTHRHACQHRKLLQFARPSNLTTDKLSTQPSVCGFVYCCSRFLHSAHFTLSSCFTTKRTTATREESRCVRLFVCATQRLTDSQM